MIFAIIIASLLVIGLILFVILCRFIGGKFLRNLERKGLDEKFKADIDISFYENSPHKKVAEKGLALMKTLPHEEVYIHSYDGLKLHATLFPAPKGGKRFVLGIHGFQSKAWTEFAPFIAFYHSIGFNMLLPDDRAHGLSEGAYITMGVQDRFDCISWADYLVKTYGNDVQILLHGVSMGASTVLSACGEKSLPKQVFGAISDCGYTSILDQLDYQMKTMFHIPPAFVVQVCEWFARHYANFDFHTALPIEQVKSAETPILFVQGKKDFLVPEEMVHRLYEACQSDKGLLVVEQASHAESIAVDPESYHRSIREFFHI